MKQSYNNENLHNELTLKIKEFIDSMEEFETTPFYLTEEGHQKSFGVLSDNGNFNIMKRFRITIEDHKLENNISEKMGSIQEENPYHPDGVSGFSGRVGPDGSNSDLTTKTFNQNKMEQTAVEWLVEQLFKTNNNTTDIKETDSKSIIEQAKEMYVQEKGFSEDDVNLAFMLGKKDDHIRLHKLIDSRLGQIKSE